MLITADSAFNIFCCCCYYLGVLRLATATYLLPVRRSSARLSPALPRSPSPGAPRWSRRSRRSSKPSWRAPLCPRAHLRSQRGGTPRRHRPPPGPQTQGGRRSRHESLLRVSVRQYALIARQCTSMCVKGNRNNKCNQRLKSII